MAQESLASISNALSQTFAPDLSRQWNRMAVGLNLAGAKAGGGKNAAWDVTFTGATASTVAEGADVGASEFAQDVKMPAVLAWAHYRSSFFVSETAVDAAASSVGIAQALQDIFQENVMAAGAIVASKANQDFYSGTGLDGSNNPTLVGLIGGGALDITGTYGGISRATFTEWKSNVLANGGVARPLSKDLLDLADQNIFTAYGGEFDWILTSAGVYRKYEGLFTPAQRQNLDGQQAMPMGMGSPIGTGLYYKGRPVYRDKDLPAGSLIVGKGNLLEVRYLPRAGRADVTQQMQPINGSNGENVQTATQIPMRVVILGKTGDSYKVSVKTTIQMLVKRPNAFALIKDIAET